MVEVLTRTGPLDGRSFAASGVRLSPAEPAARLSLRAGGDAVKALSKALALSLPLRPKSTSASGNLAALWLGPDEWLLIDEDGNDLMAACAAITAVHSAVDISHRNVAIDVTGPNVEDVLAAGCPQDLSLRAFPVGAASRTIFGKAEVVLWRRSEQHFRVECWRSFADYVFGLLEAAARDPG
ncbi:sarcosine oxidase subunit gamma [Nitratireductor luteus]|uniref:sarcosine oxidase subunit gamma n=1 Tax=Nitratireductor luteus TaxID=2976980 RepID=UPI00224011EB|nr:sarcosine oxidase subunit gamma [Nitratireductor luteus]